jgi:hypothetical protein
MIQGNSWESIGYLRRAINFHNLVGLLGFRAWERLYESEFFASQGQIDDALAMVDDAIADTEEFAHLRSPALLQRAELLAQSGTEASAIEAAYCAALECARVQGAKYYELQGTTSFARWLKSQGRATEAQSLLAEIYGWFTGGFGTPALSEAKALLDELNTKPKLFGDRTSLARVDREESRMKGALRKYR